MSGFLTRSKNDEETPSGDDEEQQEELVQNLFPKLAREFPHKEDMYNILEQIVQIIDPKGQYGVNVRDDTIARQRAAEYKDMLEDGEAGAQRAHDVGED